MCSLAHSDAIHLGMDVHKDSISVGILRPGDDTPDVEKIFHDEESVRPLVGRFPEPGLLRTCYEAGPTGYGRCRLLVSLGARCEVIAPSMIPKAPGDKVKTDTRDCRRLARLHRAGELVAIRVPTPLEEAVRDLCRTRGDMVQDLTRARNRLSKFLLRHSLVWRGTSNWTRAHDRWLDAVRFAEPALELTYSHYRGVVTTRDAQLAAVEADPVPWFDRDPFADAVHRLGAYRGVTHWAGWVSRRGCVTGDGLANASAFMGLAAWSRRSTPVADRRTAGISPRPATPMSAPSSSKEPGNTGTVPLPAV